MQFIVSSLHLARQLEKINFKDDYVLAVESRGNTLILQTEGKTIEVDGSLHQAPDEQLKQDYARWDYVLDLVKNVNEQPVVLEIHLAFIRVIFQC